MCLTNLIDFHNLKEISFLIMTTIAIIGFFILILVFFYLGKDDFGLKPTLKDNQTKDNQIKVVDEVKDNLPEEIKG